MKCWSWRSESWLVFTWYTLYDVRCTFWLQFGLESQKFNDCLNFCPSSSITLNLKTLQPKWSISTIVHYKIVIIKSTQNPFPTTLLGTTPGWTVPVSQVMKPQTSQIDFLIQFTQPSDLLSAPLLFVFSRSKGCKLFGVVISAVRLPSSLSEYYSAAMASHTCPPARIEPYSADGRTVCGSPLRPRINPIMK